MSEQPDTFPPIDLKPIISYPREAQAGQTYLMTIDVQLAVPGISWPYPEEEYPISFILDTQPYFSYEPLDGRELGVVLHRFGGTYGPAKYLLTATRKKIEPGHIHVTLISGGGLPIAHIQLECLVKSEAVTGRQSEMTITRRTEKKQKKAQPVPLADLSEVSPEAHARMLATELIERKLRLAGWEIQDLQDHHDSIATNIAPQGLALRTSPLSESGEDYILAVDREVVGIIKVQDLIRERNIQSLFFLDRRLESLSFRHQRTPLPFLYETNGHEILFINELEPEARSRHVSHFHQPATFANWLSQAPIGMPNEANNLLRSNLRRMPPIDKNGLYNPQALQAIIELEKSLTANHPRALIQMPEGLGNTTTLAYLAYRLLHFAQAQRVLCLISNDYYTQAAYNCFDQIGIPGTQKSLVQQFRTQTLQKDSIDHNISIYISTFEKLHFALSSYQESGESGVVTIPYNPYIPIEFFDIILITNCDQEVCKQWRPLFEYFDAFLIGATYDVNREVHSLFNKNLVYEYAKAHPSSLIAQHLWKYHDQLRDDGFSREDYLEQLTYLLFLKAAAEHPQRQLLEASERLAGHGWSDLRKQHGSSLVESYQDVLSILGKEPGFTGMIFKDAQHRFQEPGSLKTLIELIDEEYRPEMSPSILGDIYEELLEKSAETLKSGVGQYFTPYALVQAIVDAMQPSLTTQICDPACGTGGFLVRAYRYAMNKKRYTLNLAESREIWGDTLTGWERNPNIVKYCVMNIFMHNIITSDKKCPINIFDSLNIYLEKKFDIILSDLSSGRQASGLYDEHIYVGKQRFTSPKDADFAYIHLALNLLKPSGRAALIVPNSVLFRETEDVGEAIRRELLEDCDLHTILLLPKNTFPHTGISAAVLFFDKMTNNTAPGTKELWVYDLRTNQHFTQRRNPLRRKHFEDFVRCYNPRNRHIRQETECFRRFGHEELIKREGCNLDISWLSDAEHNAGEQNHDDVWFSD